MHGPHTYTRNRDASVDIAKGLCILLVVCIHTEVFAVIPMPFTFIAVPMFFFMSGFFDRSQYGFRRIAMGGVRGLLAPAAVWTAVGTSYGMLLTHVKGAPVAYHFDVFNPCSGNGPCWFLVALFWVKLAVCLLSNSRIPTPLVSALCLLAGYYGITYQLPLYLDEALAALPLYHAGKLAYPHRDRLQARASLSWGG